MKPDNSIPAFIIIAACVLAVFSGSFFLTAVTAPLYILALYILYFVFSLKYPAGGLVLLFFLLPWIEALNSAVFKTKAIPAVLLFTACWLAAYALSSLPKRKLELPKYHFLPLTALLIVFASAIYAVSKYTYLMPVWNHPITVLYLGKVVYLKNALGWIAFESIRWTIGILMMFFVYDLLKKKDILGRLSAALSAGLFVTLLIALYQKFVDFGFLNITSMALYEKRVSGGCFEPNCLACVILLSGGFLLYGAVKSRSLALKLVFAAEYLLSFYVLALSGSRMLFAGMLLAAAAAGFLLAVNRLAGVKRMILASILLAVFAGGLTASYYSSQRLQDSLRRARTEGILRVIHKDRRQYWKAGVGIAFANMPFGTGVGRYLIVLPDYMRGFKESLWTPNEHAGSSYLQAVAEMGLAGFLYIAFLFYFIVYHMKRSVKKPFSEHILIMDAVVIVMAFAALVSHHFQIAQVSILFWCLIAVIMASKDNAQQA